MKAFCELFDKIDQTKSTKEKISHIKDYFLKVSSADAAWALYFLSGNKLKRLIGPSKLLGWGMEALSLPSWLILESLAAVGDMGETIALLIGTQKSSSELTFSHWIEEKILPLQDLPQEGQKEKIFSFWQELNQKEIFILNKILTGSFRVGVSYLTTVQAFSEAFNVSKEAVHQRLMGKWTPTGPFFEKLKCDKEDLTLNPYPFFLASPVEEPLDHLGQPEEWVAEWKWDGIRAQAIHREGKVAIWSRRNELVTHQFPEIEEAIKAYPDRVLDGEILAYKDGKPLSFGALQKRLGRKSVSKNMLEIIPLVFMIYDVLEYNGKDCRKLPFLERRKLIGQVENNKLIISPLISFQTWDELRLLRAEAPANLTEGLILKKKNSSYGLGRRRGNWWKYKIDARTIDAVLIYAQPGSGWRANLYTDYTFGVWQNDSLVPIAKAYSGLTQDEIYELDRWIRKNTEEKFGPVRKVKPEQVFEIAFEGVQISKRHKSGIAFRFPRIYRWRKDKLPRECNTLESVKEEFL